MLFSEMFVICSDWGAWTGGSFRGGYRYPWTHDERMIKRFKSKQKAEAIAASFSKSIPSVQVKQISEVFNQE
jgi:hypothetical protein